MRRGKPLITPLSNTLSMITLSHETVVLPSSATRGSFGVSGVQSFACENLSSNVKGRGGLFLRLVSRREVIATSLRRSGLPRFLSWAAL